MKGCAAVNVEAGPSRTRKQSLRCTRGINSIGGLIVILVVMLHNVGGLAVGYFIGTLLGMPDAKRKAVSIEVGMQNSGLASSLATLHFAACPMATIPGAIVARIYARADKGK